MQRIMTTLRVTPSSLLQYNGIYLKAVRILYVIQKVGQDNLYVKVERGIPVIVTDINKATQFSKNEAEKYINNQIRKSQRELYYVSECKSKTIMSTQNNSENNAIKNQVVSELKSIKSDIVRKFSKQKDKCIEKLQYYDGVILDIRHYIRNENTRLNACQAAKVLYKLQQIERSRADVKREIARINLIQDTIDSTINNADNFEYAPYKPRVIEDMDNFLKL